MIRRLGRAVLRAFAILLVLYALAGFVSLRVTWLPGAEAHQPARALEPGSERVVSGVVSVHTDQSHDATGSVEDVVRAARAGGIRFAIIGDHPPAREPWISAEYRDSVLIGYGMELVLPEAGRGLLFGMSSPPDMDLLQSEGYDPVLESPTTTAVVIHGRSPRERERWKLEEVAPMHGWEVMDLSEAARRALASPWSVYHAGSLLLSGLTGTTAESLLRMDRQGFRAPSVTRFDSLSIREPLTALAGLNHHPKSMWRGRPFPDYEPFFQTLVNNVVLGAEAPTSAPGELHAIGGAIRQGRVFISLGRSPGAAAFRLAAVGDDGQRAEMGQSIALTARPRLRTSSLADDGVRPLFRVIRDGTEVALVQGDALDIPLDQPGVYRVEVYRYRFQAGAVFFDLRPWIFSNPLRVTV